MNKKNVPTLLYTITKSELGGAQSHVYDLIESLHDQYKIHLVVGSLGRLADQCEKLDVAVHHLPILTRSINPFKDLRAVKEFMGLIKTINPDLIHAHSGKPGVVARLAGSICNVPVIFTAHGWGFDPNAPILRRTVALIAEKLLAPLATKIICVCKSDYQLAIDRGVLSEDRVVMIHNGIRNISVPIATPEASPPQLIMVARFNEQQKDHYTLMTAIKSVSQDIHVVFVGTGPDWEKAKGIAKDLDILSKVSFFGDRLDVETLLANAQIFVLTTHYEGLPISILEAMRAGLPIIATNVNGIPEAVIDGETGLLVPHEDVPTLLKAINSLTSDSDMRTKMGNNGLQKFVKEFTTDRMVEETKLLYQSIIESKTSKNSV